jgi:DNA-binding transcriptional MocR family regulator
MNQGEGQEKVVTSDWLAEQLTGRSAPVIADDVAVLIRRGRLAAGAQLPSVRALAARLGVSPSTVSAAWTRLKQQGLITSHGRSGSRVVGERPTPFPARYRANPNYDRSIPINLSVSVPELELLPDLRYATGRISADGLNSYERERITPGLEAAVRPSWPYPAQSLLTTNAGYEGIHLVLSTFIRAGDRIVLETPALPRMIDLGEVLGARMLFAPRDAEGLRPEALRSQLEFAPTLILLQPGVHNPSGASMSKRRAQELAELIRATDSIVVEVDQQNTLFPDPIHPLSALLPDQHVFIRSYSKSHGPDLRIAVLEGPERIVQKVHAFLEYGSGWTSRILQNTLAWMLQDPGVNEEVSNAAMEYRRRAMALRGALRSRGLKVSTGHGLELMVSVRDEQYASGYLRSGGVAVGLGSPYAGDPDYPWIRVSTGKLDIDCVEDLADLIAAAAS